MWWQTFREVWGGRGGVNGDTREKIIYKDCKTGGGALPRGTHISQHDTLPCHRVGVSSCKVGVSSAKYIWHEVKRPHTESFLFFVSLESMYIVTLTQPPRHLSTKQAAPVALSELAVLIKHRGAELLLVDATQVVARRSFTGSRRSSSEFLCDGKTFERKQKKISAWGKTFVLTFVLFKY